jgi:hypothetical protein
MKQNKKISLIIFVVLSFAFISACFPSGNLNLDTQFRKGSEGLQMSFLDNLPPQEILAGDRFSIGINLENRGAYDITEGRITLSGYQPNQYAFVGGSSQTFQLEGKSQFVSQGEVSPIIFDAQSLCYPSL